MRRHDTADGIAVAGSDDSDSGTHGCHRFNGCSDGCAEHGADDALDRPDASHWFNGCSDACAESGADRATYIRADEHHAGN